MTRIVSSVLPRPLRGGGRHDVPRRRVGLPESAARSPPQGANDPASFRKLRVVESRCRRWESRLARRRMTNA